MLDRYTHHPWWENAAMIHVMGFYRLLGGHIDIPNTDILKRVEFISNIWNSLVPSCMAAEPIIVHYAGRSKEDRERELSEHTQRGLMAAQVWLARRPAVENKQND